MKTAGPGMTPASPTPFDAERVERRRRLVMKELDVRDFGGERDQEFHERSVLHLAILAVADALEMGSRNSLGYPTHHLTLDDDRIDHLSAIV